MTDSVEDKSYKNFYKNKSTSKMKSTLIPQHHNTFREYKTKKYKLKITATSTLFGN